MALPGSGGTPLMVQFLLVFAFVAFYLACYNPYKILRPPGTSSCDKASLLHPLPSNISINQSYALQRRL